MKNESKYYLWLGLSHELKIEESFVVERPSGKVFALGEDCRSHALGKEQDWVDFHKNFWLEVPLCFVEANFENRFSGHFVFVDVGTYQATVTAEKVSVGCQEIPFEEVEQVYNEMVALRE